MLQPSTSLSRVDCAAVVASHCGKKRRQRESHSKSTSKEVRELANLIVHHLDSTTSPPNLSIRPTHLLPNRASCLPACVRACLPPCLSVCLPAYHAKRHADHPLTGGKRAVHRRHRDLARLQHDWDAVFSDGRVPTLFCLRACAVNDDEVRTTSHTSTRTCALVCNSTSGAHDSGQQWLAWRKPKLDGMGEHNTILQRGGFTSSAT
jgi:hypothetical protein